MEVVILLHGFLLSQSVGAGSPHAVQGSTIPPTAHQCQLAHWSFGVRPPLIELQQSAKSHCVDHNLSHKMFSTDGNSNIHTGSTQDRTEKLISSASLPLYSPPKGTCPDLPPLTQPLSCCCALSVGTGHRKPLFCASQEALCHPGPVVLCKYIRDPRQDMLHLLVLILLKHIGSAVKNLPAMRETWVRSLSWEDPLEMGKATHSSILAQRIPWTVCSMESQRVRHD